MSIAVPFILMGGVFFPLGLWAIWRGIRGIRTGSLPELDKEIAAARFKGYTREWDDPTMRRLLFCLKITCLLVCGSSTAIGGAVAFYVGVLRLVSDT
jgi:hypothetical protein